MKNGSLGWKKKLGSVCDILNMKSYRTPKGDFWIPGGKLFLERNTIWAPWGLGAAPHWEVEPQLLPEKVPQAEGRR